ncbi:hypothetical protein [Streptomyces sp. DSM 40907]|uniref:hypothetical protein n=1 Tax=Streptomyces kutzneri TaxID=3051179 RepID=UPI0028D4AB71|nr:hypothetical protein [Streptomyces sp. DSM 40907]
MEKTPAITVGAPDDLGWRKVCINGKTAGKVRSPGGLQRFLRRAGVAFDHEIHWLGGDSTVWPDRAWKRRTIATLMAVGLLATAIVLSNIGIADTLHALSYAGRIAGVTFIFFAVVGVIAAALTLDYWHKRRLTYSGAIILLGVLVAFGISWILLAVQLKGQVYSGHFPVWIALALWSSWALCILVRGRAWKGIRNPKQIAIGAIIPIVLAIANLTYSQVYIPYVTTPLIQSGAEFRTANWGEGKEVMYVPVHLYVKNSGKVPVYILSSIYWVHGKPENSGKYELIGASEFVTPAGRLLDAGEEYSQDAVVEIKNPTKSTYEAVRAQTEIYAVRKDRIRMATDYALSKKDAWTLKDEGKDKDPQGPSGNYYRYQSEITNSSEILNVTRGRQRVTVWWVRHGDWPYIFVNVAPPGTDKAFNPNAPDKNGNKNNEVIERYGLTQVRGSMAQTPFVDLMEQAQAEPSTP